MLKILICTLQQKAPPSLPACLVLITDLHREPVWFRARLKDNRLSHFYTPVKTTWRITNKKKALFTSQTLFPSLEGKVRLRIAAFQKPSQDTGNNYYKLLTGKMSRTGNCVVSWNPSNWNHSEQTRYTLLHESKTIICITSKLLL